MEARLKKNLKEKSRAPAGLRPERKVEARIMRPSELAGYFFEAVEYSRV